MDAKSVRNMYSIIAVTNKHTAKLHHVGSLYILTYDARKLKHKKIDCLVMDRNCYLVPSMKWILDNHNFLSFVYVLQISLMCHFSVELICKRFRRDWLQ